MEQLGAGTSDRSLDAVVVYNIMRAHAAMVPFIDNRLRELNVTAAQFNVLVMLFDARAGLPLSEIGRQLVVTKPNVTGLIDRLVQKGWVERAESDDRRVTLARITGEGVVLMESILPQHEAVVARVVDSLTKAEKQQLSALLTKLRRGIRQHREKGTP